MEEDTLRSLPADQFVDILAWTFCYVNAGYPGDWKELRQVAIERMGGLSAIGLEQKLVSAIRRASQNVRKAGVETEEQSTLLDEAVDMLEEGDLEPGKVAEMVARLAAI